MQLNYASLCDYPGSCCDMEVQTCERGRKARGWKLIADCGPSRDVLRLHFYYRILSTGVTPETNQWDGTIQARRYSY